MAEKPQQLKTFQSVAQKPAQLKRFEAALEKKRPVSYDISNLRDILISTEKKKVGANGIIKNGITLIKRVWGISLFLAKAITNVNKYSARGKIHKCGIAAKLVVIKPVRPNIRLEGIKAINIQRNLCLPEDEK